MIRDVIPILQTERLILRAFKPTDLDDYAALCASPDVAEFTGGNTRTLIEIWNSMAEASGQWVLRDYGLFAVEHFGRIIGIAGVVYPMDWPEPSIAYSLHPSVWGRGLATDAVCAVRDWAFVERRFDYLASFILPGNARSIRVAEKLGALKEGTVELRGKVVERWVYRRASLDIVSGRPLSA
jgi:RimJ/RimL family protein N-acetyltransferase